MAKKKDHSSKSHPSLERAPGKASIVQGKQPWPGDDELVALMEEHQSLSQVARTQGKRRESLRDYLSRRPALDARMREHIPKKRSEEEQARRNREAKAAYSRRIQAEDPERKRAINRKWAKSRKPEDRRRWNIHNRHRRAGIELTQEAIEYIQIVQFDRCSYCGGLCEHIDHIDAIAVGGTGEEDNLTSACGSCNASKGQKPLLFFLLDRKVAVNG